MAKVGRAAYAHSKERIQLLDSAQTLVKADSGETLVLNSATGFTTTLPAAQKGLYFRILIAVESTDGNLKVATQSGEYFYGGVRVISVNSGDNTSTQDVPKATAAADPASYDHLRFDADLANQGGMAGDIIELHCVEDGAWVVTALIGNKDGNPTGINVIGAS